MLMIAGEESGDIYAGRLAEDLLKAAPELEIEGLGGPRMRKAGVNTFHDIKEMSSVGVASMLGKLGKFLGVLSGLEKRLSAGEYKAVVLVDYPDFNMRVAKAAHKAGVPAYYYVCPQFWAWRRGRIEKAKEWIDLMLVVFPFEEEFYRQRGLDAMFLGHPILDELPPVADRTALRRRFMNNPDGRLLGVLPGSRHGEIKRIFPVVLESVKLVREKMDVEAVVPCAGSISPGELEEMAANAGVEVKVVSGMAWEVMNACDFLICKSGTSTLQAALARAPMLIVYKSDLFSFYMARALSYVEYAGLPNLLAGREIAPEFLQTAATPEAIAEKAVEILSDGEKLACMREDLGRIADSLGKPGASQRAAGVIVSRLRGDPPPG